LTLWDSSKHFSGKGTYSSLWINPWQIYGASPATWEHTPATRHRWTRPALTPAMQAGTRFTYPGGMEGWVDLVTRKRSRRESNSRHLGPESNALSAEPPSNLYWNRAKKTNLLYFYFHYMLKVWTLSLSNVNCNYFAECREMLREAPRLMTQAAYTT